MSVCNSAPTLAETLESVLSQEGVDFEFIVVNDGSTDGSGDILDRHARSDSRLRVHHQENTGLTRALIRGCGEARGEFIARQDAGGDVSLPGRLAAQCQILRSRPEIVMTSCATQFIGPEREVLYEVRQDGDELHRGLMQLDLKNIRGPSHHGSTMFRRSSYTLVAGYRPEFYVAQDIDLWLRLSEIGLCYATTDVRYRAQFLKGSLSHLRRGNQVETARVILACAEARRSGRDCEVLLAQVRKPRLKGPAGWMARRLQDARYYTFLGRLLRDRDHERAGRYLRKALKAWPLHPHAWYGLLRLTVE